MKSPWRICDLNLNALAKKILQLRMFFRVPRNHWSRFCCPGHPPSTSCRAPSLVSGYSCRLRASRVTLDLVLQSCEGMFEVFNLYRIGPLTLSNFTCCR
jgi:hypothetical protein